MTNERQSLRARERACLNDRVADELRGRAPEIYRQSAIDALARVPREAFVPEDARASAYEDRALRIAHGQTISQPFVVAYMTCLLDVHPEHRVLEIGTGSGYQAAVLAELARAVYTVEIVPGLALTASERLARLGYANVEVARRDGQTGWPEHAPYDRIIVTAGGPELPEPLREQLKPGGRLVMPIGEFGQTQWVTTLDKDRDGTTRLVPRLAVRFVPLTGGGAGGGATQGDS